MEPLWSGSIDEWTEAPSAGPKPLLVVPPALPSSVPSAPVAPAPAAPAAPVAPAPEAAALAGVPAMEVEVVRSAKRRKSVSARIVDGRIVIRMPQWMTKAQEAEYVTELVAKLERQNTATTVDLPRRARELAKRYDLPEPSSITWVSNQQQRWGSCTPSTGEIRISDRIAGFPDWVVDAVIVHELAHLVHLAHSAAFWALANRYPKTERAYGFLIAKQLTDDDDDVS
ncbi:MAG: M48 metallopeptidase family protein [Microthrixaceae bacterium]